jgi:hypothetical protein
MAPSHRAGAALPCRPPRAQAHLETQGGSLDKGSAELARRVHLLEAELAAARQQQERGAQALRDEQFRANRLQVRGGAGRLPDGVDPSACAAAHGGLLSAPPPPLSAAAGQPSAGAPLTPSSGTAAGPGG